MNQESKIKMFHVLCFMLHVFIGYWLFSGSVAEAASMYLSPAAGSYEVGENFIVKVFVSSLDQAMNAAQANVSFPPDLLELTSLSKANSLITLWPQEPAYSNTQGDWQFEGGAPNPGFTGSDGQLLAATFRAKKSGPAYLTITNGSVLANDGLGTQLLSEVAGGAYNILPKSPRPKAAKIIAPAEKAAGKISSPTHPDPDKWYANNNPKLAWSLPPEALGVSMLADRFPDSDPGLKSRGLINSYSYQALADGVWYFHISLLTDQGWGSPAHFRFQVDTKPPGGFEIQPLARDTKPKARFIFSADDETSGLDHYEISLDSGEPEIWTDGGRVYATPILAAGKHLLIAKAVDQAGNFLLSSQDFIIEPFKESLVSRLYSATVLAKLKNETRAALESAIAVENLHIRAIKKARELRRVGQIDKAKRLEAAVRRNLGLQAFSKTNNS